MSFTNTDFESAKGMRESAITVLELMKGFNGEPDRVGKTILKLANDVMVLTNMLYKIETGYIPEKEEE